MKGKIELRIDIKREVLRGERKKRDSNEDDDRNGDRDIN